MKNKLKSTDYFHDPAFPLVCTRIRDHVAVPLHSHEFHEMVIILAGKGRHITDQDEYELAAGDVFVLRDRMVHGYRDTERMTLVNILFDPAGLGLPLRYLRDLPGYHALFRVEPRLRSYNRFQHRLRLSEGQLARAAGFIEYLQQELRERRPGYRFQAGAHLMNLIAFVSRCWAHADRVAARPLMRIDEVLGYIEQHYGDDITIQQLCRLAHMSESSLARAFHKVLGRAPMEHVIRVRVQKAAEMLRREEVRVTETAYRCGFSDSNYFSRQFRQIMGISPRKYRAGQPSH